MNQTQPVIIIIGDCLAVIPVSLSTTTLYIFFPKIGYSFYYHYYELFSSWKGGKKRKKEEIIILTPDEEDDYDESFTVNPKKSIGTSNDFVVSKNITKTSNKRRSIKKGAQNFDDNFAVQSSRRPRSSSSITTSSKTIFIGEVDESSLQSDSGISSVSTLVAETSSDEIIIRLRQENDALKKRIEVLELKVHSLEEQLLRGQAEVYKKTVIREFSKQQKPSVSTNSFQATATSRPRQHFDDKERPFVCGQCGTAFTEQWNLVRHIKNIHALCRLFECSQCSKPFATLVRLNNHEQAVHGTETWICDASNCGKEYKTEMALKYHKIKHSDNFKCAVCDRRCSSTSVLAVHQRTHNKKKGEHVQKQKEILEPAVEVELKRLDAYKKTLGPNFEIKIKGTWYCTSEEVLPLNGIIQRETYDPETSPIPSLLIYIPYTEEHKTAEEQGHFVTSSERNPFDWIRRQISNSKNGIKGPKTCTHVAQAILKGKQFDYAKHVVVAAADSFSTCLDLKFTANTISLVSNRIKKPPALHTVWNEEHKKFFLQEIHDSDVPTKN